MYTLDKRPQLFSEMIGNENIMIELRKRARDINFDTYNIFHGDTGIGKSTAVFIITKLLNCKNPIKNDLGYFDPCNECPACKDIIEGKFERDVHYLDASKMGKAEVQELNQLISRYAMYDRNKIVIIDEAHLLASKEAKSAMLLMTEKIRKNSYLFMCTTQPGKIASDLYTRLTQYKFTPPTPQELAEYLLKFIEDNEIYKEIPDDVDFFGKPLLTIAFNSGGSVRQALKLLERCILSEAFTVEDIINKVGLINEEDEIEGLFQLVSLHPQFFDTWAFFQKNDQIKQWYEYMSFVINKVVMYKVTKNSEFEPIQDWEIRKYHLDKMVDSEHLDEVFSIFTIMEEKRNAYYFSQQLFMTLILDLYNKVKSIPKISKDRKLQDNIPKRRKPAE